MATVVVLVIVSVLIVAVVGLGFMVEAACIRRKMTLSVPQHTCGIVGVTSSQWDSLCVV